MNAEDRNGGWRPLPDNGPISTIIGFAVVGVSIWALVCAARVIFATISNLFEIFSPDAPSGLSFNVILGGFSGVFAAAAVAVMRAWPRKKPGKLQEFFVSAIFNKDLINPKWDGEFVGKIFVSGIIGFLVGNICGAGGMISFPQLFPDSTAQMFQNASSFPILAFAGGGFGGPDGGGFLALLFLIFVVFIISVVFGCFVGFFVHLAIAAGASGVKGATKAKILKMLEEKTTDKPVEYLHPIRSGAARGALTGLLVGIFNAIFTAWGVVHFHVMPSTPQ